MTAPRRGTLIAVAVLVAATVALPVYTRLTHQSPLDPSIHSASITLLAGWAALIFHALFGGRAKP